MEIGISSFAFGWSVANSRPAFDAFSVVEFAREQGVRVVQIGDHLPLHEMPPGARTRLRKSAGEAGIRLELGARGLTGEHLETYVGLCRETDARLLRFVVDRPGYEPPPDRIVAIIRDALPGLRANNVVLGIENHDRFPARLLREIIDSVNDPMVGVCLDTANSFGAGEGLEHVSAWLAPVAVNLHVKDVSIRRFPHQQGFVIEGCELGRGILPIRETIAAVDSGGRCPTATLEAWTAPDEKPDETARIERERAIRSLATLRTWMNEAAAQVRRGDC